MSETQYLTSESFDGALERYLSLLDVTECPKCGVVTHYRYTAPGETIKRVLNLCEVRAPIGAKGDNV